MGSSLSKNSYESSPDTSIAIYNFATKQFGNHAQTLSRLNCFWCPIRLLGSRVVSGYDMLSFHLTRFTERRCTTESMVCLRSRHLSSKSTAPGRRDMAHRGKLILLSRINPIYGRLAIVYFHTQKRNCCTRHRVLL